MSRFLRRGLPYNRQVAVRELVPLRPRSLRPGLPRQLRRHPRRPGPHHAEPGEESRGSRRQDREKGPRRRRG